MTYTEIIDKNVSSNICAYKMWPRYAYHYTDIRNATKIINSGILYCREKAALLDVMANDNASEEVLSHTRNDILNSVRFYFRPKTPTQYYNEGYKFRGIRYQQEDNANVPIPVFFIFKLDTLLTYPGVKFSEMAQSGMGSPLYSTPEEFAKIDFEKIYGTGPFKDSAQEKKYRHAEILCPDSYPISNSVEYICCRNDIERQTLLNLISGESIHRYGNRIIAARKQDSVFERNGFYIENCTYVKDKVIVNVNDTYSKKEYYDYMTKKNQSRYEADSLVISAKITDISSGKTYTKTSCIHDYLNTDSIHFNVSDLKLSDDVFLEMYLIDNTEQMNPVLMAKARLSLLNSSNINVF